MDVQDLSVEEIWTGARGARWTDYICRRTLNGFGFEDDLKAHWDRPPQFS